MLVPLDKETGKRKAKSKLSADEKAEVEVAEKRARQMKEKSGGEKK